MIPAPVPPIPGDWYRHRINFDRCVTVIRLTDAAVMIRNERGRVDFIAAAEWLRSFYLSK